MKRSSSPNHGLCLHPVLQQIYHLPGNPCNFSQNGKPYSQAEWWESFTNSSFIHHHYYKYSSTACPADSRSITSTLTWRTTLAKDRLGWKKKIQEQTFTHLMPVSELSQNPASSRLRRPRDEGRKMGTATSRGLKWKGGLTSTCWSPASDFPCSVTWSLLPGCWRDPFILLTWSAASPSHPWPHTGGRPALSQPSPCFT